MSDEDDGPKRRPLWPFAIVATLIAVVLAAIGAANGVGVDDLPKGGFNDPDNLAVYAGWLGYAMGSALMAAGLVWLVFYFLVFRNRAPLSPAVLVFAIMFVFATLAAAPVRVMAVGVAIVEAQNAAEAWENRTSASVRALSEQFRTDMEAVAFEGSFLTNLRTAGDVEDRRNKLQRAEMLMRAYIQNVDADIHAAEAETAGGAIEARLRHLWLNGFKTAFNADAPYRRILTLQIQRAQIGQAALALLAAKPDAWRFENGIVRISDEALLTQVRADAAQMDALLHQVQAQQAAADPGNAATADKPGAATAP